jgi:hypothetical protein
MTASAIPVLLSSKMPDEHLEAEMAELVAIAFEKPDEADRVLTELARLQKEYLIWKTQSWQSVSPTETFSSSKASI